MQALSDSAAAVFGSSVSRFVEDNDFTYVDFRRRGEKSTVPTFRASDFSWDDYGFSLGNGLYTDIGTLLDDKFSVAQNLTYYTLVSLCCGLEITVNVSNVSKAVLKGFETTA